MWGNMESEGSTLEAELRLGKAMYICPLEKGDSDYYYYYFCLGCLPKWEGILAFLNYFREGALEKGERRE
jgi:hypothetical protein